MKFDPQRTLFLSDLDGTLLSPDSRLSTASAEMLNRAIGKGALFSVATARTPSTVATLLADVDTRIPFIVMTGAALWNPADCRYSHTVTMPPAVAGEILATLRKNKLSAFMYSLADNIISIRHTGPVSPLEQVFIDQRCDSPFKTFHIPPDGESVIDPMPPQHVVLFYAMQPSETTEKTFHEIRKINGCNPVFYHDMFGPETAIMEIFDRNASKARALDILKKETSAGTVVAFGDNVNDLPMMRAADVAVAVGNAIPEVREAADIVIGTNDEDAVARFILDSI